MCHQNLQQQLTVDLSTRTGIEGLPDIPCAHMGSGQVHIPVPIAASRENQICCTAQQAMQVSLHHRFARVKHENDTAKQHVCSYSFVVVR